MTNICPVNGHGFEGRCGRRECWFHGTRRHPTRCARLGLGNKDEITPSDIGYLFDVSNRQAVEAIEAGRAKITAWIKVFEAIDGSSETVQHRCPHCGVGKLAPGSCLNREKCSRRMSAVEQLILHPVVAGFYPGLSPHQIYAVASLDREVLECVELQGIRRLYLGQQKLLTRAAETVKQPFGDLF